MATIDQNLLRECLVRLLRPIVKFCLSHGLKLQDVTESLKVEFIESAKSEAKRQGFPSSVSRLSVMTGVHRPDVQRLFEGRGEEREPKNQIGRIIGQWQHDKRFTTPSGKPKTLAIQGKQSEFVDLVQSVSADLNPYTVLFELERSGLAERSKSGLKLISRLYVPKGNVESGFDLLAKDMEDLVFAVSENIFEKTENPNLHIRTEYDNIPLEYYEPIRKWLLEAGSGIHEKARDFLSKKDRDLNPELKKKSESKSGLRVIFGTFARVEKFENKP